eukprot:m.43782 g.43782  ORF g.43782 m.43782 type:complete len:80 (-) comp11659_c0_seq3:306-545(-)
MAFISCISRRVASREPLTAAAVVFACAFRRRAKSCTSRTESAVSHSGQATSVASFSLSESATCLSMQEKQNRCEHASNE